MKKHSILLAVVSLILASLACQTFMGGGNTPNAPEANGGGDGATLPTSTPGTTGGGGGSSGGGESEFPMPKDASNVVNAAGVVNFQTDLTLDEAMNFYRDQFGKLDYTERGLLTVTSDTTFSMVFDGDKSGKAIVVQGVDLGDGTVNISISLQDI